MARQKDSFLIYYQFQEQVDELTDEEAGFLFKAIFHYEIDNIEPDFSLLEKESIRLLKSMFINIRKGLDINKEKYISRCNKNRENIQKRWNNSIEYNSIQSNTKHTDIEKDIDIETDIEKVKETVKKKDNGIKKIIADLPPELQQPVLDFMDMRKSIKKPMTDKALELMISKLNKMSNEDTNTAIDILNQSIMNSWQGIFPLKAEQIAESKTEKELNAAYTMISDWVGDENV